MADALNPIQGRPRASFLRKLSLAVAVLAALLVAAYFIATSSAFIKSFVLPRVAQAVGVDISVAEVSLSPFSQVILRKAQVRTAGTEPLLMADEIKASYDLFAILRGDIDVQEVSLIGPQIQLVTDAGGKSNWTPLLSKSGAPATRSAKPIRFNVRNVSVKDGKIRLITRQKEGAARTIELNGLNLTVDQLRSGGSSKATLTSEINFEQGAGGGPGAVVDRTQAKLSAEIELALDAQLKLGSVKGSGRIDLAKAEGAFKDLAGLSGTFQADSTLGEIKQLALRFERGGKSLGSILASGPFNLETQEARLKLEIQSIDRQVLNVIGAARGWDFGDSVLNASGTVESSQKGAALASSGVVTGRRVSLRQSTGVTPPLDVNLEYQVNLNLERKTGSIEKLILSGQENQKPLLQASLDRPMQLNWGTAPTSIPDSTLKLTLQDFNLQSWRPLLGTNIPSGRVNLQWTLQAQQDGKKLNTQLVGDIQDLAAKIGTNVLEKAQARFDLSGQIENLKVVDVNPYRVELLIGNQIAASSHGTMRVDLSKSEISLKADSEASIPDLLKPFPVSGLKAMRGQIKSSSTFTQNGARRASAGKLELAGFTGGFGSYDF